MENPDKPAYPSRIYNGKELNVMETMGTLGLTKREMFAMAAMQGVCAKSNDEPETIARESIQIADELLRQLTK